MKIETTAVHAGAEIDSATGAVAPPIHLSTTFEHGAAYEDLHGYMYVRDKNPTQDRLEEAMAQLEGGVGALVFGSGMGAAAAVLQTLDEGGHVVFPQDLYVHVRIAQREFLPRWRVDASVVDTTDLQQVKNAIKDTTKLVWLETPSNPCLNIADIKGVCDIAHSRGAQVLVDSTFATPILQRPLNLGADIVLHSTTKYCGGHSDVQGGCLVLKTEDAWYEKLLNVRTILGAVSSPFNSWLVLRGLRTLGCRMEKHSENAAALAKALEKFRNVEKVFYPGLESHAGYEIARRQMSAFGGMLALLVRGGSEQAIQVASRMKLFQNATSLGGVESLVEHRASAEGPASQAPKNLLRLSVGLEHHDDLLEDLRQALQE